MNKNILVMGLSQYFCEEKNIFNFRTNLLNDLRNCRYNLKSKIDKLFKCVTFLLLES